jgi:hypothetical protein
MDPSVVPPDVRSCPELFGANGALERPRLGVLHRVPLHGALGDELLAASGARVALLARVDHLVLFKRVGRPKASRAKSALERELSGVNAFMRVKVEALEKSSAANIAYERLFLEMRPEVPLKVGVAVESLLAILKRAMKWLFFGVLVNYVTFQPGLTLKFFLAKLAFDRRLGRLRRRLNFVYSSIMTEAMIVGTKLFVTNATLEPFFLSVCDQVP